MRLKIKSKTMQKIKLYYLMFLIPLLIVYTGCSSETTEPLPAINEAEILVKYLETNGNPVEAFPKMIKAVDVYTNILTGADQYVIDIRTPEDYNKGHIQGAVNVVSNEVLNHYESNNLQNKADGKVIIVCYTGQGAGWATALLHLKGYTNARDLKWGMCSWSDSTANSWKSNVNNSRMSQFVKTVTQKPADGELPKLETGKQEAKDILNARIDDVFAQEVAQIKISSDAVYSNLSNYQIINYWNEVDYNWGHIDGAIQYTPDISFKLDTDLKTLSTEKPIAIYCYTGQTSAHIAAYLSVLGYDVKSILFGVNGMSYDNMPGTRFIPENEIHDYPLVH